MRTVKRAALPLNSYKLESLKNLCTAYSCEKQHWLNILQQAQFQAMLGSHRKVRDQFVKQGYCSVGGLQARHWKLALQDAVETWDRYWQALFVQVRSKIAKRRFKENEKRYAYFLLKGYEQFAMLMQGEIPEPSFELDVQLRGQIAGYVRRLVKRLKGKSPILKKSCSVKFDANCYELFEHQGRQYVKLMSLKPGKRIIVPLKGETAIKGNITVVFSKESVQIHVSQDIPKKVVKGTATIAVDFGYTEVMTDAGSNRYGEKFGTI